jgi:hypothetical protein
MERKEEGARNKEGGGAMVLGGGLKVDDGYPMYRWERGQMYRGGEGVCAWEGGENDAGCRAAYAEPCDIGGER